MSLNLGYRFPLWKDIGKNWAPVLSLSVVVVDLVHKNKTQTGLSQIHLPIHWNVEDSGEVLVSSSGQGKSKTEQWIWKSKLKLEIVQGTVSQNVWLSSSIETIFRTDSWFDKKRNKSNKIIGSGRRETVTSERLNWKEVQRAWSVMALINITLALAWFRDLHTADCLFTSELQGCS